MTLWQKEPNSIFYTNEILSCDICGKKSNNIIEYKLPNIDKIFRGCFHSKKGCAIKALKMLFAKYPDIDHLLMRQIISENIKQTKKRDPLGLSKRYNVMKRDGFQCVLCGAYGKDAKLEIDHIIPISAGGSDSIDNLRTLCFKCNRGKRSLLE